MISGELPMKKRRKSKRRLPKNFYLFLRFASTGIIALSIMIIVIFAGRQIASLPERHRIHDEEIKKENFIEAMLPYAIENREKYNIFPSITIAQAILESNWGESVLSKNHNNYFGIKSIRETDQRVVFQTNEYINGRLVQVPGAFRAYDNLAASMEHYGLLIGTADRYIPVINAPSYIDSAKALYECGYSTDPAYPDKLINLIKTYALYKYDS